MPKYNLTVKVSFNHTAENIQASSREEAFETLLNEIEENPIFEDQDFSFDLIHCDEIASTYTSMSSLLMQNFNQEQSSNSYTPMTSIQNSRTQSVSGYTPFSRN